MDKDIQLLVPLVKQPQDKDYCALACVQMIASFYDKPIPLETLEINLSSVLSNKNVGITPASARVLVEQGLTVTVWTRQLELMSPNTVNRLFSDAHTLEDALEKDGKIFTENAKTQWKEFVRMVESGGTLSTQLATLENIDAALAVGTPVRLSVAPKALYVESLFNTHAIVVTGKKKRGYVINDPSPRFKESYIVDPATLLFAWYTRGAVMFKAEKKERGLAHKRKAPRSRHSSTLQ